MRKAIAALIAVALTVLTLGTPAQASTHVQGVGAAFLPSSTEVEPVYVPASDKFRVTMDTGTLYGDPNRPIVGDFVEVSWMYGGLWGEQWISPSPKITLTWYVKAEDGERTIELEQSRFGGWQWQIPEELLGQRIRGVITAEHEGYEFEPIELVTKDGNRWLDPVLYPPLNRYPSGRITYAEKDRYYTGTVTFGEEVVFQLDQSLPDNAKLECQWRLSETDDGVKPDVAVGDCNSPLLIIPEYLGRLIYVTGEVVIPQTVPGLISERSGLSIKLPNDSLTLELSKPDQIRYQDIHHFALSIVNSSDIEVENPTFYTRLIKNDRAGKAFTTSEFSWAPRTPDEVGSKFELFVTMKSDNFDTIVRTFPLGALELGRIVVARQPIISRDRRTVHLEDAPLKSNGGLLCYGERCTYNWMANDKVVQSSTKNESFEILPEHFGTKLKLSITYTQAEYAPLVTESSPIFIEREQLSLFTEPEVKGAMKVGFTVSVANLQWVEPGVSTNYQWYLNGKPIAGATKSSYLIPPTAAGKKIHVAFKGSHKHFASLRDEINQRLVKNGNIDVLRKPGMAGGSSVGSTLKVSKGKWSPSSGGETYSWYVNGKKIKHTATTLKLTPDLLGKRIKVRMNVNEVGYTSIHSDSADVVVTKSTAKVSGKPSTTSIRKGQSAKLAVTVKVPGTSKPTGKVTVTVGKKTFTKTVSSSQAGKVTVYLYGLSTGSNQAVKVKFTPSSSTAKFSKSSATTTVGKITVKK